MVRVYESSMSMGMNMEARANEFQHILSAILDPLLNVCILGCSGLKKSEQSIYILNCLYYFQVKANLSLNSC